MKTLLKFNAVGLAGIFVQLAALSFFQYTAGFHYLAATALAVESAVIHNFWWHWRWTWADRDVPPSSFLRFQLTTGATSILGNVFAMKILTGTLGIAPVPANVASIAILYVFNFLIADRYVFRMR